MVPCIAPAHWFDTDHTTTCELPYGHEGPHCDGTRWFVLTSLGGGTRFAVQVPSDHTVSPTDRTGFTSEIRKSIIEAYHCGAKPGELAKRHGTSTHNIQRMVYGQGVTV